MLGRGAWESKAGREEGRKGSKGQQDFTTLGCRKVKPGPWSWRDCVSGLDEAYPRVPLV